MNYWLEQAIGIAILIVIAVAVLWEFSHLVEWNALVSDDRAHYLREHAYHYVTWLFGTDFGWFA